MAWTRYSSIIYNLMHNVHVCMKVQSLTCCSPDFEVSITISDKALNMSG
jgi:hypothetical protein